MRINGINNTQSFGMACRLDDNIVQAVEKMATNPKNATKLRNLKTICMAFDEMPGDFYVGISNKHPKKFLIGLLQDGNITAGRLYKKLKPQKVIQTTCQDMGEIAYKSAQKNAAQDIIQVMSQYFNPQ